MMKSFLPLRAIAESNKTEHKPKNHSCAYIIRRLALTKESHRLTLERPPHGKMDAVVETCIDFEYDVC